MNPLDLTDEQRLVITKVEKLLRLAGSTTHPEEAASAAKKAADLLLAYNLSEVALGHGDDGRRGKDKMNGGFYEYDRNLMRRIADVNFCLYWHGDEWVKRPENEMQHAKVQKIVDWYRREHIKQSRHHLVGRTVSIIACRHMYEYLTDTIERCTKEYLTKHPQTDWDGVPIAINKAMRSRAASSFREGMAEELGWRLWTKREDQLREEREKAKAAAANGNGSTSNAVTIASVRQSEYDANMDVMYGAGWSARQRQAAADRAAAKKAADEEYARWAEANPEEAAKLEAKRKKEREAEEKKWANRGKGSRGGSYDKPKDWHAYQNGSEAGKNVSLDPQIHKQKESKKLA